jgi:tetratricopeptide (TPR) repeat protein
MHVQFAYYQSSLVVEYLVGKFGFTSLQSILRDLAKGVEINDAISKHTAPMEQVEKEFAAFAKAKAEALGPELDWKKPADANSRSRILEFPEAKLITSKTESNNYWALLDSAKSLVSKKDWEKAKAPLKTLIELYPNQSGANNAYALLAAVHRELNETTEERVALEKWAAQEADALEAYSRLMELAQSSNDWKTVSQNAERFLAVNPLLPQPYRYSARASEETGETKQAMTAYEKLLLLDPADPAQVHFRLATLLQKTGEPSAKRHALQALEEAPRYRDAQRLLLELVRTNSSPTNSATSFQ